MFYFSTSAGVFKVFSTGAFLPKQRIIPTSSEIKKTKLAPSTKFKGALSGLKQFLAAESPIKMMQNAFYFTSKAYFVLKIFRYLS